MAVRVTIGIPIYNGAEYIGQAMDSLLGQSFRDFEIIISDNGSTDPTQVICEQYAARHNAIRYYREDTNRGAAWNYNRVFALAQGEYFKWAAHDDVCGPEFIRRCVEALDQHPRVVLAYPKTLVIDEGGRVVSNYPDDLHFFNMDLRTRYRTYLDMYRSPRSCNPIFGLIRRDVLAQTPLIGAYVSSDTILLAELALRGEFYEVPETLFFRRDHANASIRAHKTYRDLVVWFDPQKRGKWQLPRWRWLYEFYASIRRVPMRAPDKLCCYVYLMRWAGWNLLGLIKDIIKVVL